MGFTVFVRFFEAIHISAFSISDGDAKIESVDRVRSVQKANSADILTPMII